MHVDFFACHPIANSLLEKTEKSSCFCQGARTSALRCCCRVQKPCRRPWLRPRPPWTRHCPCCRPPRADALCPPCGGLVSADPNPVVCSCNLTRAHGLSGFDVRRSRLAPPPPLTTIFVSLAHRQSTSIPPSWVCRRDGPSPPSPTSKVRLIRRRRRFFVSLSIVSHPRDDAMPPLAG